MLTILALLVSPYNEYGFIISAIYKDKKGLVKFDNIIIVFIVNS